MDEYLDSIHGEDIKNYEPYRVHQFEGMPQFNGIQEILVKLRSDLKFAGSEEPFVSFENNQDLKGLQFFRELYDALQNKTTLEVTYKDFKSPEPYTFIFHPHPKLFTNR